MRTTLIILNMETAEHRWELFSNMLRTNNPDYVDVVNKLPTMYNRKNPIRGCLEAHILGLEYALKMVYTQS